VLDPNITLFSFEAKSISTNNTKPTALVIKECRIFGFDNRRIYSEFEEMCIDFQNENNYDCGLLEIEFVLDGINSNQYPVFYTKCFAIRNNNGLVIKPLKTKNTKCFSKVDSNGKLVVKIGYFFHNMKEANQLKSSSSILIEGFVAFKRARNVYGMMCSLIEKEKTWDIVEAYTYRPKYARNIKHLLD